MLCVCASAVCKLSKNVMDADGDALYDKVDGKTDSGANAYRVRCLFIKNHASRHENVEVKWSEHLYLGHCWLTRREPAMAQDASAGVGARGKNKSNACRPLA